MFVNEWLTPDRLLLPSHPPPPLAPVWCHDVLSVLCVRGVGGGGGGGGGSVAGTALPPRTASGVELWDTARSKLVVPRLTAAVTLGHLASSADVTEVMEAESKVCCGGRRRVSSPEMSR